MERKRIAGVPHKRLPCRSCGQPIWVHWKTRKGAVVCVPCGKGRPAAECFGLGRDAPCTSERQYEGECKC